MEGGQTKRTTRERPSFGQEKPPVETNRAGVKGTSGGGKGSVTRFEKGPGKRPVLRPEGYMRKKGWRDDGAGGGVVAEGEVSQKPFDRSINDVKKERATQTRRHRNEHWHF